MTANGEQYASDLTYRPRGEKPYLLPFNRRIRHLHGISLRNLALTSLAEQSRARTADDDALPTSLSSPSKLLAQDEARKVSHARSHSDLKAQAGNIHKETGTENGHTITPKKKSRQHALRRRSTFDWNSPRHRRRRVEDAITQHMADVFFSLHAQGMPEDQPVYVSEVMRRAMNPDFRFFDLQDLPLSIKRQCKLSVRFWARPEHAKDDGWTSLLEMTLDLRNLYYFGRTLENFDRPLPDNCVLYLLTDGIYASPASVTDASDDVFATKEPTTPHSGVDTTSSFDALMKLSNLDTCVQDALATHRQLTAEIRDLISSEPASVEEPIHLMIEKDVNASASRAVNHTKHQISRLRQQATELRKGIASRRNAIREGREGHVAQRTTLADAGSTLSSGRALLAKLNEEIAGQRRRAVSDLSVIYPVEPAARSHARMNSSASGTATPPSRRSASPHPPPLSFTIRGLSLPNSSFANPGHSTSTVSTALGHVAHTLTLLSAYFSTPLPYPLAPRGSVSTVSDPISNLTVPLAQRTFPLYLAAKYETTAQAAGTAAFDRFEYAVFLLNKDLEMLAGRAAGLRVLEIRQTLPNLKYLALVATAGPAELPLRKPGGVKGLLLARAGSADGSLSGSGPSSRRGSDDSEGGRAAELVRRKLRVT